MISDRESVAGRQESGDYFYLFSHHPITPSPHHPITPSPHSPITPSPHTLKIP
ncbi:hypothetical protein [Microcystis sp. LE19-195.1E]|uniref:hypothetical protein n=1 Tax=Microcystis sp. LE19-195.1E TaxID=3016440 RepID=UPI00258799A4|nr:hypothetical protein [Microcystis sp. LE19-195.1E]